MALWETAPVQAVAVLSPESSRGLAFVPLFPYSYSAFSTEQALCIALLHGLEQAVGEK